MRILRDEILASRVEVRKIASPAAGDDYLAADLGIMFNDENFSASFPGLDRAKQPGRTAADNYGIVLHSDEITLVENANVMPNMPGHTVDEGTR